MPVSEVFKNLSRIDLIYASARLMEVSAGEKFHYRWLAAL
jgi:hypothetical protein